jgi:SAM-dependent methyltransferase
LDFVCNLCGTRNTGVENFGREVANCAGCHSSVRARALLAALSLELFGTVLPLPDFPTLKSIRGIGLSDDESYAARLAGRFDYRNTWFDRPPVLDISAPDPSLVGSFDFLLAAEIFEHVRPPAEQSFRNALSLLKPEGVLVMSVPYKPDGATEEHFPALADYRTVTLNSATVLVNRQASGDFQVFDQLVFHGGPGSTLEMRVFSESGLRDCLASAGFRSVRIHSANFAEFGILHSESWSLPIGARRQPSPAGIAPLGELVERCRTLQSQLDRAQSDLHQAQEQTDLIYHQFVARTAWATSLDRDLNKAVQQNHESNAELEKRTAWAQSLESQLVEKTKWAQQLEADLQARTEWARDLERQFLERTEWAKDLDSQVDTLTRRIQSLEQELKDLRESRWHRLGQSLRRVR